MKSTKYISIVLLINILLNPLSLAYAAYACHNGLNGDSFIIKIDRYQAENGRRFNDISYIQHNKEKSCHVSATTLEDFSLSSNDVFTTYNNQTVIKNSLIENHDLGRSPVFGEKILNEEIKLDALSINEEDSTEMNQNDEYVAVGNDIPGALPGEPSKVYTNNHESIEEIEIENQGRNIENDPNSERNKVFAATLFLQWVESTKNRLSDKEMNSILYRTKNWAPYDIALITNLKEIKEKGFDLNQKISIEVNEINQTHKEILNHLLNGEFLEGMFYAHDLRSDGKKEVSKAVGLKVSAKYIELAKIINNSLDPILKNRNLSYNFKKLFLDNELILKDIPYVMVPKFNLYTEKTSAEGLHVRKLINKVIGANANALIVARQHCENLGCNNSDKLKIASTIKKFEKMYEGLIALDLSYESIRNVEEVQSHINTGIGAELESAQKIKSFKDLEQFIENKGFKGRENYYEEISFLTKFNPIVYSNKWANHLTQDALEVVDVANCIIDYNYCKKNGKIEKIIRNKSRINVLGQFKKLKAELSDLVHVKDSIENSDLKNKYPNLYNFSNSIFDQIVRQVAIGQYVEPEFFEIARSTMDFISSNFPGISAARDAYEFFEGKDAFTNMPLTDEERSLNFLGLITLGTSNTILKFSKFVQKFAKRYFQNSVRLVKFGEKYVKIVESSKGLFNDLSEKFKGGARDVVVSVRKLFGNSLGKEQVKNYAKLSKELIESGAGKIDDLESIAKAAGRTKKGMPLLFDADNAVRHFKDHADQVKKVFNKPSYNLKEYMVDANHVVKTGQYSKEFNAYVKIVGGPGDAKAAFVGLKNAGENISTFHIKDARWLSKKDPSLGWSFE